MAMIKQKWSVSGLATEFEVDRRTVAARINKANVKPCGKDGRSLLYWMADVAPALIDPVRIDPATMEEIDYQIEKARLTKHQADKAEMESATIKGDLLKREHVSKVASDLVAATRSKLLNMPQKLAAQCVGKDRNAIQENIAKSVHDALLDISELRFGDEND